MKQVFSSREGFLYDLLRYHLRWADQRGMEEEGSPAFHFQPLLSLASCEALAGDYHGALPAAAAVELVYNFTLVHGEVQAGAPVAEDRPSIWWVWGPAQAINAGDGLHAMARVTIMRLAEQGVPAPRVLRAVQALDQACLTLCEGQFMDLTFQEQLLVSSKAYYEMVHRKTGALTGCSAELGALSAGAADELCSRFGEFGTKLGVAWQISQDIADLWGQQRDGMTASNVLSKKKGLPLVYALEMAGVDIKRQLGTIYMKRVLEPEDAKEVVNILDRLDARQFAASKANEMAAQAIRLLEEGGLSTGQLAPLKRLADLAVAGLGAI